MKKIILISSLMMLLTAFHSENNFAQWQPDVRLTNDTARSDLSRNYARCIESNENYVHVVWYDYRDGNPEIYYRRSLTGGMGWGADTRLTNDTALSRYPSLTVSGLFVHVVWSDSRDGTDDIFYKRSMDGGYNWGADTRITNNSYHSSHPSIAKSGSLLHLVWSDNRDGNYEIYYKRSITGGSSWGTDTRLTNNIGESGYSSIAVSDIDVHVVWRDLRDGNQEIYYKRSTNGGSSWGADTRLTNNSAYSEIPSISVSGQNVHVVWSDYRDGNYEIYYKRSINGGSSWGPDKRLTVNNASSMYPSISASGSALHVVWYDARDWNDEIYYIHSTDDGSIWGADTRLTSDTSYSWNPTVSVSGSVVNVLWQDNRGGNYEIYYKRNPTGNPFGIKNISSEIPKEFSLSQNYPNPFNPKTKIRFEIPPLEGARGRIVKVFIYDILGREITTLVNEQLSPGTYEVDFDPGKSGQAGFTSGVYYYSLITESFKETKRMVFIK